MNGRTTALFTGLLLPVVLLAWAMWSVHTFTVDDAYISFRYAQNLVDGHGLVFNPSERVEGYTNFLWTVLLAGGLSVGLPAEPLAKALGAFFAVLTLILVYQFSRRLSPQTPQPVLATWLVAGNMAFAGYAMQGLETAMFTCLLLAGALRFCVEEEQDRRSALGSTVFFALAALTRPEAPLYLAVLMLVGASGRSWMAAMFSSRNLQRGVGFALVLLLHVLWRYHYYGSWLPNTVAAKTGGDVAQLAAGFAYVRSYAQHQGLVAYLFVFAGVILLLRKQRMPLALLATALAAFAGVVFVGGDWMVLFRFMVPIIPFISLVIDVAMRGSLLADAKLGRYCAMVAVLIVAGQMMFQARADVRLLHSVELEWDRHAGGTALWFKQRTDTYGMSRVKGQIALGDIGEVAYVSGYPILDLLGLVDPIISRMPGGYTRKVGTEFRDYVFAQQPRYIVIISNRGRCDRPSVANAQALFHDKRFAQHYAVTARIWAGSEFFWCIYEDRELQLSIVEN